MRFIVYGAGAIGGVMGAGLARAGEDVLLIARGEHGGAIARSGLRLVAPDATADFKIPVVSNPTEIEFAPDDVVILAMKTQDTHSALNSLAAVAPPSTAVVCAQNGVENERLALRLFENVYGICVVGGTTHLEPGVVAAESGPVFGSLDIGRYPGGIDDLAVEVSSRLDAGGWVMFPRDDVMRWKYTKLLRNLVLAIQALCGPNMRQGAFFDLARAEGERCLEASGIAYVGNDEWNAARALGPEVPLPPGGRTIGGSSWQSLARGTGSIESAYLNGEIILLGRLNGIPTPANLLLYELGLRAAATGEAPGSHTEEELFERLDELTGTR